MNDYVPPCRQPANDPDDWFIEKNGRQYEDEPILTKAEVSALWDETVDLEPEERFQALKDLTDARVRENLIKRRHAKDACFTECLMRTQCLSQGFDGNTVMAHGIWGGYYPEELRALQRERRSHRRRSVRPQE